MTEKDAGRPEGRPAVPPSISLPKGGGAIQGIAEKFAANPATGTGGMSVPLATTPGRSGIGPKLALSYDSGSGNGPFGFGWSLSLPFISRKTDKGLPQYEDAGESDVFVLSGAEDLVPVLQPDGTRFEDGAGAPGYVIHRYRPRTEGLFARIERWTRPATGEVHWRSITRDNVTTLYGKDDGSRISDPSDVPGVASRRVFSWLISETYDDKGNAVVYAYVPETDEDVDRTQAHERNRQFTSNRYLKRVKYGNRTSHLVEPDLSEASWMFEVLLDYDEGHYEEVPLDPALQETEQHRFVRASESAARAWAVRPDPFSTHRPGFEVRTYRRCRRVLMFHHVPDLPTGEKGYEGLVRSTEFDYDDLDYGTPVTVEEELAHPGSTRFASFIRRITQSGYRRDDSQTMLVRHGVEYPVYLARSLPPLEFEYSGGALDDEVRDFDAKSLENLPGGLDGSTYRWIDLHGEGIPGILTEQADAWFYKRNLSPLASPPGGSGAAKAQLGPLELVASRPDLALSGRGARFMDLGGDGPLDLVVLDGPMPGFYEHDRTESWAPFRPLVSHLNRDTRDPNLKLVDLNGDGHADVLITEDDAFLWHPSMGEEGFGPSRRISGAADEDRGPRLLFNDGTQSVYLADMCGDGLADLARIRNGEICYWPNLGYGRFAAKVTMSNAPVFDSPDQFDQDRIRLADIDGTGTTDIVYLSREGVSLYFNQSGNRISDPHRLDQFPPTDDVASVMTADVLGNGTACLLWSSPLPGASSRHMRYIDLMGGTKPHLLVKSVDNAGAETEIFYAPSTKFYLADKRDGRPWITRLPFPVHVVERVVTHDRISGNRFVSRYAYHHGHFDGTEREFRGFGMVEQWDTEEFAAFGSESDGAAPTNAEAPSHVPPVLTKTWFHTGTYAGRHNVSNFFAGLLDAGDRGEYYRPPGSDDSGARELLLEDTVLPDGLTPEEEREACRALKGRMLRQEIYSLDASDREPHPFTVTEQNFALRMLQPRKGNRHGVFLSHARESISYHYERRPEDPRVGHALTLEVDDFGNVLRSVAIAYGRRSVDATLAAPERSVQEQALVSYNETRFTNAVDAAGAHRVPLSCESRTYQLTGLDLAPASIRHTFDEVLAATLAAVPLEYRQTPTSGSLEKRLIEHTRSYYRRNSLDGPLPLGGLESLALPFEGYKLALTAGMVVEIFGSRSGDPMLEDEGGYLHTEGDTSWWIPAGRIFYSPGPGDSPAQELAYARGRFFLPHRYRDAFHTQAIGTESIVTYDAHALLVQETRDALGNRVTVGELDLDPTRPPLALRQDYRVMQPSLVMDANRNRTEVAFDAFGMVVGTASMGRPSPSPVEGDSLDAFPTDLTPADIDRFFQDPRGEAETLLGDASTRIVYDPTAYWREPDPDKPAPAFAATLTRETHASEAPPPGDLRVRIDFSYSDGFGREIQRKAQAEPGPLPRRLPDGRIVLGADGLPEMTTSETGNRWVGSGWTVFNNKGKPVRQFEPFFTDTHRFELDVRVGVSPVLFYDPVGRVVATLHPNHTWEKVVFDAWRQETWDVNDTVLVDPRTDPGLEAFVVAADGTARLETGAYEPSWHALRTDPAFAGALAAQYPDALARADEALAAEKTLVHAATPTVTHGDPLGRTFLTVAHNRAKYTDGPAADPPVEEFHRTRVALDIEGNKRAVMDAQGRVVMRTDYDMLGGPVHVAGMDSGERWTLKDAAANPLYSWDARGHRFRTAYDPLRRPIGSYLQEGAAAEALVGRTVYGETTSAPEDGNVRGRIVEVQDQAGVVTTKPYDFKGNLLTTRRRLTRSYRSTVDWSGSVPLEPETFTSRARYDAVNRPVQLIAPHSDAGGPFDVVQLAYNESNLLEKVHAWLDRIAEPAGALDPDSADVRAVEGVAYDAKGRRRRVDHGNGVSSVYEYDRRTSRLSQLLTRRDPAGFPADCPQPSPAGWPGCWVQNLHYTYDPAGNVTHIRDDAQQTIFFRNTRVEPSADFRYDAVYRLIEATGREHLGQAGGPPIPHSYNDEGRTGALHPSDGNAMGRYVERYVYDEVGNFLATQHRGSDPAHAGWIRSYVYDEPSQLDTAQHCNRLSETTLGGTTETFSVAGDGYDAHGNLLRMPHLQQMRWDSKDQLQMTQRQAVGPADSAGSEHHGERTWYVYDSAGRRVRKVTELPDGSVKDERIYLGELEIYRRDGVDPLVRETLHLMDDKQRIATVETRTSGQEPGVPTRLTRYQLGNHLGSAAVELDGGGRVISYEEYTPYGSTSYQAVRSGVETPKRYRYTGKERDEESGLYYNQRRYYCPWLGRWVSADPVGLVDGPNLYRYSRDTPVLLKDPTGLDPNARTYQDRSIHLNMSYDSSTGAATYDLTVELQNPGTGERYFHHSAGGVEGLRSVHQQLQQNAGFVEALRPEEREALYSQIETFAQNAPPAPLPNGERVPTESGHAVETPARIVERPLGGAGNVARGIEADRALPQRYRLEPARGATVTGIRDTQGGAVRGNPPRPVGAPVIRVDRPHGRTNFPHVNVETLTPDPHHRISPGALRAAGGLARGLETAGRVARPVAIVTDAARLGTAIYEDQGIGRNTARTAASVAGGWAGAFAGAWAGAKAGAALGGLLGSVVPGLGNAAGAAVGGLLGGLIGGIAGGFFGSWAGESAADAVLE